MHTISSSAFYNDGGHRGYLLLLHHYFCIVAKWLCNTIPIG